MFDELLGSIREGGAILRGRKKASRRFVFEAAGVRAIRERTSLSQSEFADLIGVSVKTIQNWSKTGGVRLGPPRRCCGSSHRLLSWRSRQFIRRERYR